MPYKIAKLTSGSTTIPVNTIAILRKRDPSKPGTCPTTGTPVVEGSELGADQLLCFLKEGTCDIVFQESEGMPLLHVSSITAMSKITDVSRPKPDSDFEFFAHPTKLCGNFREEQGIIWKLGDASCRIYTKID